MSVIMLIVYLVQSFVEYIKKNVVATANDDAVVPAL